jgi:vanillate O-demethylase monooxygenase subunit
MHYFWAAGRDFGTGPESMAALETLTRQGFAEDEAILEAIQLLQQRDPRGAAAPEVSVRMDTAGVQARRIVARWMERDA